MTYSYLKYPLSDGFIHHWLAAGPIPFDDSSFRRPEQADPNPLEAFLSSGPGIDGERVDLGLIGGFDEANPRAAWRYYRCREDHLVDFKAQDLSHRNQVAYSSVILTSSVEQDIRLTLTGSGLVDLWLDLEPLHRLGTVTQLSPKSASFGATLHAGDNEILVRVVSSEAPGSPQLCALRVGSGGAGEIETAIATSIEPADVQRRMALEEVVEAAFTDRYVYGYLDGDHYNRNESIALRFSPRLSTSAEITYRLQSLSGDIFQEGTGTFGPSDTVEMARTYPLRSGPHHLALLPTADLYYVKKLQFERKELLYIVRTPYSVKVSPSYRERKASALKDACERRGGSLFSEIARMALRDWEHIDRKTISDALARVKARMDDSVIDLLGLLGMLARFGKKRRFPKEFKSAIAQAAAGIYYTWSESDSNGLEGENESRQITLYACEILAGALLPDEIFTVSGKTGRVHREHGEQGALVWMRARGKFGFRNWDSPDEVESAVAALTHLVDLAEAEPVSELASVLLDKIFFSLAVNSYAGAYASSRGSSRTAAVFSARLAETSGISRLLWGLGNYNEAVMGTVSLACCAGYSLPKLIEGIATDQQPAVWSREQHSQPFAGEDRPAAAWRVNKVTYRTADTMLSSAQDYYPGQQGSCEHIWQAVLGPDALVFTNHPANMSVEDSHRPNLWRGNGVLPRVAQWGDVLVAVYRLPEDDWMGFTHAYFPAAAFDEMNFSHGWAFARVGGGYLALTACRPFEFMTEGPTANRELRSSGRLNTWICHMGQELLDGTFADFQQKILAADLRMSEQSARLHSLRGDWLEFGWEGSLLVNDTPQPLDGFGHIESPYCAVPLPAAQMDILHGQSGIRLKFD